MQAGTVIGNGKDLRNLFTRGEHFYPELFVVYAKNEGMLELEKD